MTTPRRGPVVADTNVFGARLRLRQDLRAARYEPLLAGRKTFISFQTVMELEYIDGRALRGFSRCLCRY